MTRIRQFLIVSSLAALAPAGCTSDDHDGSADQEVAVAGSWAMPASVHAVAQTQFVAYDDPPAWDNGIHCGGGILPGAKKLADFLNAQFPQISSIGGYACRPNTANTAQQSVHGTGRALDVMIPTTGGSADNTKGDAIANWLATHAELIGIQLIIWDHSVWSPSHSGEKLQPYGGPVPHIDHLHVEVTKEAAAEQTAWFHPPPPPPIAYTTVVGDFNGDGKKDLATVSANANGGWANWVAIELSTGTGFSSQVWAAKTPQDMRNGGKDRTYKVAVGDFNGDGKSDLVTLSQDAGGGWADWADVELSTGTGFTTQRWPIGLAQDMRNGGTAASYLLVVADFNGDGKSDLATVSPNAGGGWADWADMELSTGTGFVGARWALRTPQDMRNGGASALYRVVVGDFNGDGKADLAAISPNASGGWGSWLDVSLSTGSGFTTTPWAATTPVHMRNGGAGSDYRVVVGDFNGDGKTDVVTMSPNASGGWADWAAVELSTGAGFSSRTWAASTPQDMRNGGARDYRVLAGDFDGDGKTDLATISPDGGGGWADWAAMEMATGSAFASTRRALVAPQHMRNGGKATYKIFAADFDGGGKTDLLVLSPDAGGGWASWAALGLSSATGFTSTVWPATTPQHMRNGM